MKGVWLVIKIKTEWDGVIVIYKYMTVPVNCDSVNIMKCVSGGMYVLHLTCPCEPSWLIYKRIL